MTKTSRILLFMSLAVLSSLSNLMANPMQAALASVHCVRQGYEFTVKVTGCEERKVTINTCLGTCLSMSTPTGPNNEQVKSCTCCQPIKTENVDVELWCDDKNNPSKRIKYFHKIETTTECACASC
ncbi:Gremlin 2, DAN BMP antagonist [Desmophyllum pertusum]|uniref:Gremlin 2, DAN BMP antagonist n=1 Tax=Desmophyllum pertusum TaxID=174260 RepID=A0A9W9YM92_9CNID|nr:Gremlin 2, DAN BMP antagonist [Desmophyllum pertusum]